MMTRDRFHRVDLYRDTFRTIFFSVVLLSYPVAQVPKSVPCNTEDTPGIDKLTASALLLEVVFAAYSYLIFTQANEYSSLRF